MTTHQRQHELAHVSESVEPRPLRRGDVLLDPYFSERYRILATGEETGGAAVRVEAWVAPGPSPRPESTHPGQEEQFTVLSGVLALRVGDEERVLRAGEQVVVPAGTPHLPRNGGDEELRFVAELRPALRFDRFLAGIVAVNQSGARGLPYLLRAAIVLQAFPDVERPTRLPRPVERTIFGVLASLGRLGGYRLAAPTVLDSERASH